MLLFLLLLLLLLRFVYGAKVRRKKLKKNLFAIVFLISFATRVLVCLLVRSLWSRSRSCGRVPAPVLLWWSLGFLCSGSGGRSGIQSLRLWCLCSFAPAMVLLLWWSLVFRWWWSLWCLCSFAPALAASCTILLMLAKWAYTHTRIHAYTRNNF